MLSFANRIACYPSPVYMWVPHTFCMSRYMSTRDAGEQRSLLRVISTILQLTKLEVAAVEARIAELEKTMVCVRAARLVKSELFFLLGLTLWSVFLSMSCTYGRSVLCGMIVMRCFLLGFVFCGTQQVVPQRGCKHSATEPCCIIDTILLREKNRNWLVTWPPKSFIPSDNRAKT